MHALKPVAEFKQALPDNRPGVVPLSVATKTFRPDFDFRRSRLDAALTGPCTTRPIAPADDTLLPRQRADHDLVVRLCRLPPDLAAPLLRSNLPALTTAALLTVIAATGEAHHQLIAARPGIDWRVVKALIRRGQISALVALVRNDSLDLDDDDQRALAAAGEHAEPLRAAIFARPGLHTAQGLLSPAAGGTGHSNLKLVKLLRAGEAGAFAAEAAHRLSLEAKATAIALAAPSAVPLALAFCALGLDRAVFLDLLHHRQTTVGEPALNAAHRPLVLSVFALAPEDARHRLMALANSAMTG